MKLVIIFKSGKYVKICFTFLLLIYVVAVSCNQDYSHKEFYIIMHLIDNISYKWHFVCIFVVMVTQTMNWPQRWRHRWGKYKVSGQNWSNSPNLYQYIVNYEIVNVLWFCRSTKTHFQITQIQIPYTYFYGYRHILFSLYNDKIYECPWKLIITFRKSTKFHAHKNVWFYSSRTYIDKSVTLL